jgi:hypothetical protein
VRPRRLPCFVRLARPLNRDASLTSSLVRHSCSRVISAIASIELEVVPPQWPELLPFLYQLAVAPNQAHRAVGYFILFALLDTVAECLQSELPKMFATLGQGLNDPESLEVRITALR